jgi:hypothetical protein
MGWLSKLWGDYGGSKYPSGIVNLTASCPQCTPGDRGECLTGAYADREARDTDKAIGRLRIEDAGRGVQMGWSALDITQDEAAEYDARFTHAPQVKQPQRVEVEQPISVPNWPAKVGKR